MMESQRNFERIGRSTAPEKFVCGPALTMTLKTDKERKRRSTPKSRNGCYSCKFVKSRCSEF